MKKILVSLFLGLCAVSSLAQDFKELKTDHFIIYYTAESDSFVYKVKDDAEFLFRKITDAFSLTRASPWTWDDRTKIHIAPNKDYYLTTFQCPQWSGACVDYYRRVIYSYPSQENFYSILTHELTHIIFREYVGMRNLPLWIDEGMAMYMEQKDSVNENVLSSDVKNSIKMNTYIPFTQINNIGSPKALGDTRSFYVQSFSMVYFLIRRYGQQDFGQFLSNLKRGDPLHDALRKAFGQLENESTFEEAWKKYYSM